MKRNKSTSKGPKGTLGDLSIGLGIVSLGKMGVAFKGHWEEGGAGGPPGKKKDVNRAHCSAAGRRTGKGRMGPKKQKKRGSPSNRPAKEASDHSSDLNLSNGSPKEINRRNGVGEPSRGSSGELPFSGERRRPKLGERPQSSTPVRKVNRHRTDQLH